MHRRLLRLAGTSRLAMAGAILSGALVGIFSLLQAYALSSTIDGAFLNQRSLLQLGGWLQILLLAIACRALLGWVQEVASNEVAVRVKADLRQRLFGHLLALGPTFTHGERSGELAATAVEGVEALDAYFSQYLPQLIVGVLVPVSILAFVFPIDPLSGAILLVTAPLIPVFMYLIGRDAQAATSRQYATLGRLSSHFLDSLQGLTTLKLFGQSRAQAANIARVCDQFRTTTLRVMQVSFLSAFALELLTTMGTALIAVEVGLRLLYGQMAFREALFLIILAPEFYMPLRLLGMRFHAGMAGTAAAQRIFQILEAPAPTAGPTDRTGDSVDTRPSIPEPGAALIDLQDVSYTYPGRWHPALRHLDFSVRAGQHVAIVGTSGAGKSTLASVLLGFVQPTSGRVLIAGGTAERRGLIAWVPQQPYLFNDSIAANLRLGRPDCNDEEMRGAARAARLEEAISSRADGYQAQLGEGGAGLSQGEAQRLAIARALLMKAPILLFDEPTSSLDPENEQLLEESVEEAARGRTVITIAHRLKTVRKADQIVVLEDGQIVESGTHDELLRRGGAYARLVHAGREVQAETDEASARAQAAESLWGRAVQTIPGFPVNVNPMVEDSISTKGMSLRLLGFLHGLWGWIALAVLLGCLTIGANVALMGTAAWLISAAALHPSIGALQLAIVGVRFFGIARAVFRYLERLVSHGVTFRLLRNIRVWFYQRIEPLAPAGLLRWRSGDLLARVIADVESLENLYVRVLAPPLSALVVSVGVCAFLAYSNIPQLAWVLAGAFALAGVALPVLARALSRRASATLVASRAALHTQLVDGIQGLADILAFGRGHDRLDEVRATGNAYAHAQRSMAQLGATFSALSSLSTNLALWLALLLIIPLVGNGTIGGIMLAPVALIIVASFEAVTPLPLAAQLLPATTNAARRLFEVADAAPPAHPAPAAPQGAAQENAGQSAQIAVGFRDVTFSYPDQKEPVLDHLSFELEEGARLGIVGLSGAGKTSIANVLLRFWEYEQGSVCLSGRPLRDHDPEDAREQIGYLSQHPHFFDTSIYENMRLARRGVKRGEVEQAIREVQLEALVSRLANGLDTLVGEHGMRLSAGERQRLAVAQILIKNAPVWILDEPTAHLDAATEQQILAMLLRLTKGKSALLITHRLLGMEKLDGVLVMERGRIVERGSHDQLVAGGGTYARLWDFETRSQRETL